MFRSSEVLARWTLKPTLARSEPGQFENYNFYALLISTVQPCQCTSIQVQVSFSKYMLKRVMEVHRFTFIVLRLLLHHSIALDHKDRYTGMLPLVDSLVPLSEEVPWLMGKVDLNSLTRV